MKGQEYTVMNYLVWAAFAAAFIIVVFAAYNSIVSRGCKVSDDQLRYLLQDAGKMKDGCVQSRSSIILCEGTVVPADFVRSQMGFDGKVCFCAGRGATVRGDAMEFVSTVKADVRVCKYGGAVYVCVNNPFACETGKGCRCV